MNMLCRECAGYEPVRFLFDLEESRQREIALLIADCRICLPPIDFKPLQPRMDDLPSSTSREWCGRLV